MNRILSNRRRIYKINGAFSLQSKQNSAAINQKAIALGAKEEKRKIAQAPCCLSHRKDLEAECFRQQPSRYVHVIAGPSRQRTAY
jgi:hypothetical protein